MLDRYIISTASSARRQSRHLVRFTPLPASFKNNLALPPSLSPSESPLISSSTRHSDHTSHSTIYRPVCSPTFISFFWETHCDGVTIHCCIAMVRSGSPSLGLLSSISPATSTRYRTSCRPCGHLGTSRRSVSVTRIIIPQVGCSPTMAFRGQDVLVLSRSHSNFKILNYQCVVVHYGSQCPTEISLLIYSSRFGDPS